MALTLELCPASIETMVKLKSVKAKAPNTAATGDI